MMTGTDVPSEMVGASKSSSLAALASSGLCDFVKIAAAVIWKMVAHASCSRKISISHSLRS